MPNTDHSLDLSDDASVEITLSAQPASVRAARAFVADQCADLDATTLADVELIVSELVTNAIRHGEPDIVLKLRQAPFAIDVAVLDQGDGKPTARPTDITASSGRGLAIIEQLAMRWGCDALNTGKGKSVWASIDLQ